MVQDKLAIGIVGHESAKFDFKTKTAAQKLIDDLIGPEVTTVVSGGCHLGGIDIWAEEAAKAKGIETKIFLPKRLSWYAGYKQRNLDIVYHSDTVHVIVVDTYPASYAGALRFNECYHCHATDHIKSGGCWTGWQAVRSGKIATWWIIRPDGSILFREVHK